MLQRGRGASRIWILRSAARLEATCRLFSSSVADPRRPLLKDIASKHLTEFIAIYGGAEGSASRALNEWTQTYYRRPRPDLLLGAWCAAATTPGAFTGPASFPASVFLARATASQLKNNVERIKGLADALAFVAAHSAGLNSPPQASVHSAELMETFFRALYLVNSPSVDGVIERIVSDWVSEHTENRSAGIGDSADELAAAALSLFPPSAQRVRIPIVDWESPAASLSTFEAHVTRSRFPIYAGSRYLFSGTHACYQLARKDPGRFTALLPHVATVTTNAFVDGLWSEFYATGGRRPVMRVLDVATPYMDFVEDYGVEWATQYKRDAAAVSLTDGWGDLGGIPDEFATDPYARMRFETSRYALWTIFLNAATHAVVGDVLSKHTADAQNRAALYGPMGAEEPSSGFSAFGRLQLKLLAAISPAIANLHQQADDTGIGSGQWPASYPPPGAALGAGTMLRQLQLSDGVGAAAASASPLSGAALHSESIFAPLDVPL